ncbi:hypothetical protein SFOMI_2262 [Sphingobium fuliginis]|uniref:Uncharacterized protein n=1 Tax=Sphingobium fuliginis (strain ATCC 27551) TaxID=336203 RepID=A0A292ZFR5_SPHSA|nr:hypothetical protein SFOMI_2262 [Sphingobium fuliginis]
MRAALKLGNGIDALKRMSAIGRKAMFFIRTVTSGAISGPFGSPE